MTDAIDLHVCELTPNAGIADWAQTTDITSIDVRPGGFRIAFSKKDGPDRWPDVTPPDWDGPIQYTVWLGAVVTNRPTFAACLNIWHGEAEPYGGPVTDPSHYPRNLWYLNATLQHHTPVVGETLGLFVTAGAARGLMAFAVKERSNVVAFKMPGPAGEMFVYTGDPIPPPPTPTPPPADVMVKLNAMDAKLDVLVTGLRKHF